MDGTDTNELSVQGAVERLEKALGYDEPLRMRGEGLSWMVWGLVITVGIMVSERLQSMPLQFSYLVVIPSYAVITILGTAAVWRLAGVARPALTMRPAKVALGVLAFFLGGVLVTFGWIVVDATGSYAVLTIAIATIPWGILGWAQWDRMTPAGRRAMIIAGVAMAILFTSYVESHRPVAFHQPDTDLTPFYFGLLVIGIVPFFLGLVWTFRR